VFENGVLGKIFGPKGDEVTGEWRRLHNMELFDLYSSPTIIRMIKSRRMGWAGHVAHMGRGDVRAGFWWGTLWKKYRFEDLGIDGRMMLKWIFKKWVGGHGLDCSVSGQGEVASCCDCCNQPAGTTKCL
jgi:hypothetical protein